uniref:NADH dehydrogenase subunit 2 n=1 Tax=Benedenia seriolae TaxID=160838 RepID=D7S9V4_BENSE|nr:NADH dehydrogenase subunit 2 [Benedenia seriolae]ADI24687.1 NADH dehydrogenase subunit 2 [Benedenia seriolae]
MNIVLYFSCILSIFFTLFSLCSNNLLNIWLCIELSILSVVPCFFSNYLFLNNYKSLLYYLVISSLSSGFLFSGFLFLNEGGVFLIFFSFFFKFGLFPFGFWFFIVFSSASWIVIWLISVVGKILCPIITLFLLNNDNLYLIFFSFFIVNCLFNSLYFWFGVCNLRLLWANMSLNSSSIFFLIFIIGCSNSIYLLIFYLLWSTLICLNFFYNDLNYIDNIFNFNLIFILFAIPFSLGLIYKFLVTICLLNCNISWLIIFFISLYNIMEQYYLFKLLGYNSSNNIYNY